MWTTFLATLRVNLREKSALFWMVCFPIILATLFMGIFGNLGQSYELTTMKFAVVANDNYCNADAARMLLAEMQRDPIAVCSTQTGTDTADEADVDADVESSIADLNDLLELTAVDSTAEATELINRDTEVRGYLEADSNGSLQMTVSRNTVSLSNSPNTAPGLTVSLSVLNSAIGMVNRQNVVVTQILEDNGRLVQDAAFMAALQDNPQVTRDVTLTNFKPDEISRYYYALLAMAALFGMSLAVAAVCQTQANLSTLGMRRSMAPLPKWKQITGGFLASWLCSFLSLLVALAYIFFVCKVSIGGRYVASIIAIAVASFTATALGTLFGSLPKLTMNTKISLVSAITCALSLFSGLYGAGAMELSDMIQQHVPWLAVINPTQQVTNLFYDILYYDSYAPFLRTIGILFAMSILALAGATFFLRRQRYEHL